MSHYPNPNPNINLMELTKNNSGIKTLIVVPHALTVVWNTTLLGLHNPFSIFATSPFETGSKHSNTDIFPLR